MPEVPKHTPLDEDEVVDKSSPDLSAPEVHGAPVRSFVSEPARVNPATYALNWSSSMPVRNQSARAPAQYGTDVEAERGMVSINLDTADLAKQYAMNNENVIKTGHPLLQMAVEQDLNQTQVQIAQAGRLNQSGTRWTEGNHSSSESDGSMDVHPEDDTPSDERPSGVQPYGNLHDSITRGRRARSEAADEVARSLAPSHRPLPRSPEARRVAYSRARHGTATDASQPGVPEMFSDEDAP